MAQYVLSLDQGTTSSRAVLFDHDGKITGIAQQEFTQHFPDRGWVEHDPMDILTTQLSSVVDVLARAHVRPRDVVALGIANQRETTIVWERESGKPIYNAIVWQDRRTAKFCQQLQDDGHENMIRNKTGLLIDPYFSGTKITWILDNVNGARACRGGQAGLRERGRMVDLEPDQRQAAHYRPHQRLSDTALQHRGRQMGCGPAAALTHS